jgi:hypothetical protein
LNASLRGHQFVKEGAEEVLGARMNGTICETTDDSRDSVGHPGIFTRLREKMQFLDYSLLLPLPRRCFHNQE